MIRVLDKTVADKIAAGEVIDRPVSIVKELVENALDAEASSITVELRKGGKEYIRISDDGSGIAPEDTELAFLRHATSKIQTEDDLDAISSLGFRGEALASICAVARVDMITKTRDAHAGRHVICEGSEILKNSAAGCPDGTTITVRDLFYNVPARKKFLGTDGAESRRIIDLMSRIALAYPDVRFRLINGKQTVFQTSGRGTILDNIGRIYGRDIVRDLVKVDAARDGFLLRGFVSSPGASSSSRNRQFFSVNGRIVSSRTMERGLDKAYRERLFPGRFPIAFLFLQLPPEGLDVNVHPTKKEVRFDNDSAIEDFITDTVQQALEKKQAIPSAAVSHPLSQEEVQRQGSPESAEPVQEDPEASSRPEPHNEEPLQTQPLQPEPLQKPVAPELSSPGEQMDINKLLQTMREDTVVRDEVMTYDTSSERTLSISELEVLGVVLRTYIVATDGESLCLIDQHAAHERVFYEHLLRQYRSREKLSQEMLLPIRISVSAELEACEDSWIGHLREMGYDIENFGVHTYLVRAVPAFAAAEEAEGFLRQMFLELEQTPDPHDFAGLDRLIMRSCKSAVKGGDALHPEEVRTLLRQLAACERPWSCPHGRPTIVRMTKYDLEKMFKR